MSACPSLETRPEMNRLTVTYQSVYCISRRALVRSALPERSTLPLFRKGTKSRQTCPNPNSHTCSDQTGCAWEARLHRANAEMATAVRQLRLESVGGRQAHGSHTSPVRPDPDTEALTRPDSCESHFVSSPMSLRQNPSVLSVSAQTPDAGMAGVRRAVLKNQICQPCRRFRTSLRVPTMVVSPPPADSLPVVLHLGLVNFATTAPNKDSGHRVGRFIRISFARSPSPGLRPVR